MNQDNNNNLKDPPKDQNANQNPNQDILSERIPRRGNTIPNRNRINAREYTVFNDHNEKSSNFSHEFQYS